MRALFRNDLLGSTVLADNGSLNYPGKNIIDPFLKVRFRSIIETDTLTIDMPALKSVNSFWMGYHNIMSGTVEFYDDTLTLVHTITLDSPDDVFVAYFSAIECKRVVIAMTSDDPTVYLGGAAVGTYLQLPDVPLSKPLDLVDNSIVSKSLDGQTLVNAVTRRKKRDYLLQNMSLAELNAVLTAMPPIGRVMWLDAFESSRETDPPMYCVIDEVARPQQVGNYYTIEIIFAEAR